MCFGERKKNVVCYTQRELLICTSSKRWCVATRGANHILYVWRVQMKAHIGHNQKIRSTICVMAIK